MSNRRRLERLLRTKLNDAGKQFAEAQRAYTDAKATSLAELPTDESGRARLVCRRHAEKRAVRLDAEGRPACFDADHPDCQGCLEDIRDGRVETW